MCWGEVGLFGGGGGAGRGKGGGGGAETVKNRENTIREPGWDLKVQMALVRSHRVPAVRASRQKLLAATAPLLPLRYTLSGQVRHLPLKYPS